MYEWNEMVQIMVDWVEEHLADTEMPTLLQMSEQLGYSPYHCTRRFHELTGMTLRDYICQRRISRAAVELRDSDARILDVAVQYGFSSQEAFSRAFVKAFGLPPAAYRRQRVPIRLAIRQEVFSPYHYRVKERKAMSNPQSAAKEVQILTETIPAHQFVGIWDPEVNNYGDFWQNGHSCDEICGQLESMAPRSLPGQISQTAGWFTLGEKTDQGQSRGYLYGILLPLDDKGELPEGMERREYPESDYLVFFHPPFDYLRRNAEVMAAVEDLAWSYDPAERGYAWDDSRPAYQRHYPEGYGYAVVRPVRRLG